LYIERELKKAGFTGMYELDGQSQADRREVIERFAPYTMVSHLKKLAVKFNCS
jgi:hypothetical protein